MKIGILTFHRCINYGSFWQTMCLVEEMQKRGHSVYVLDHQSGKVNIAEWKCALHPVLPTHVPPSDQPYYRKKIKHFFEAFDTLPLSASFPLEDPSQMEEFDMVIVGSDEVWNLSHPWYGYYPVFYGHGIKSKHLISYAASFGNYNITCKPDQKWINKLQHFDAISVRDKNSKTIINKVFGFEPEIVLDPCLQFPIYENNNQDIINKPYAAVYGHNFSNSFIKSVRNWALKKKISLISIGYRNDWADEQWITAGPYEFSSFIHQSDAVITNFYHGCIFALTKKKPFACEPLQYRSYKIYDLMKQIGAEKHLFENYPPEALFNILEQPVEERIYKRIEQLRKSSDSFLTEALTSNKVPSYETI